MHTPRILIYVGDERSTLLCNGPESWLGGSDIGPLAPSHVNRLRNYQTDRSLGRQ
jgi:hypothetical protein